MAPAIYSTERKTFLKNVKKNLSYHLLCNSVSPFSSWSFLRCVRQGRLWQIFPVGFDKYFWADLTNPWGGTLWWDKCGYCRSAGPVTANLTFGQSHSCLSDLNWSDENDIQAFLSDLKRYIIRLVDSHRVQANEKEGKNYFCKSHLCALFWWDKTQTNPSQPNRNANVFTNVGKSGQRLMLGVVMVVDQLDN